MKATVSKIQLGKEDMKWRKEWIKIRLSNIKRVKNRILYSNRVQGRLDVCS